MEEAVEKKSGTDIGQKVKQGLSNVSSSKTKFWRKMTELKAITGSIQDAYEEGEATQQDYKILEIEMEELRDRRHQYETMVDDFKMNFGAVAVALQDAAEVDKAFNDSLEAYINMKLMVDSLMRSILGLRQPGSEISLTNASEEDLESLDSILDSALDSDWSSIKSEETKDNAQPGSRVKKYLLSLGIGVVIIFVFYMGLALIINYSLSNQDKNQGDSKPGTNMLQDNETCGPDSFMLRDSFCDESVNTEACFYDGGDCCLEFKKKKYCKNCSCILTVDEEDLLSHFQQLAIKPLMKSVDPDAVIDTWIVKVEEVVSTQVCAVLCLDHQLAESINAWQYKESTQLCQCGWLESILCPENLVVDKFILDNVSRLPNYPAYVQMNKTISCDCMVKDILIKGQDTIESNKGLSPSTMSVWHCQQRCIHDTWFSWKKFENESSAGECKRMTALPENSMLTATEVKPGWISSSRSCDFLSKHFIKHDYNFLCPASDAGVDNGAGEDQFLILTNGISSTSSYVAVFKVDNNSLVECAHQMVGLVSLQDSTGGLMHKDGDIFPVVCGGLVSDSLKENKLCHSLTDPGIKRSGFMKSARVGAASLVMDHAQTMWLTGGFNQQENHAFSSEFVVILGDNFESMEYGPSLPNSLKYHCLEKVGPHVAILIGGINQKDHYDQQSWSINVDKMVWHQEASLILGRARHSCGVLQDLRKMDSKIIVVAGGDTSHGLMTSTVELLMAENDTIALDWQHGPQLPIPLSNAASKVTSDMDKFIVIGGTANHDYNEASRSVFILKQIDGLEFSWVKEQHELQIPSAKGLAMLLPSVSMGNKLTQAKSCDILSPEREDSILLLATGTNGYEVQSDTVAVSILESGTQVRCQGANLHLPVALEQSTGGVLQFPIQNQTSNSSMLLYPLICGGWLAYSPNRDCYHLGESHPVGQMLDYRGGAVSVVIKNGTALWVTGGSDGKEVMDTTELVQGSQNDGDEIFMTSVEHDPLPIPLAHHCLELLDDKTAILFGGEDGDGGIHGNAWTVSLVESAKLKEWKSISSLSKARKNHICGVLKDTANPCRPVKFVIAAGGIVEDLSVTKSMEILEVRDDLQNPPWEDHQMPVAFSMAGSVTNKDQTTLYVAGGMSKLEPDYLALTSVYSLQCARSPSHCKWTKTNLELPYNRASSVALLLPPIMDTKSSRCNLDPCQLDNAETALDSKLILSTGWHHEGLLDYTEVFVMHQDGRLTECSHDGLDVFVNVEAAIGALVEFEEATYIPTFCGGLRNDISNGDCWRLGYPIAEGSLMAKSGTERAGAASIVLENGAIWITGGLNLDEFDQDSSVIVARDFLEEFWTLSATESGALPRPMSFHCLQKLYNGKAILYGGEDYYSNDPLIKDSWIINLDSIVSNPQWSQIGTMSMARRSHMCGVLKVGANTEIVVGAGGIVSSMTGTVTDSVELIQVQDESIESGWHLGPKLPMTLCEAGSATTIDHSRLFIAGGIISYAIEEGSRNVFNLKCHSITVCEWTKTEAELWKFRRNPVAMVLPAFSKIADKHSLCLDFTIGDHICDGQNNFEQCAYDGGDCCSGLDSECQWCNFGDLDLCTCHKTGSSMCSGTCPFGGNYLCDGMQNTPECEYDGGDCCLGVTDCRYCSGITCFCHETSKSHCPVIETCPEHLPHQFVGDQYCDDELNIAECEYDGNDCCRGFEEYSHDHCTVCACHLDY